MKKKHGFTLVEIIVVLAIIAILLAITVPSLFGFISQSKEVACTTHIHNITYDYQLKSIRNPDITINEVLVENDNGDGLCPDDGVYTVQKDQDTGLYYIHCSVHGGKIFYFTFPTGTDAASLQIHIDNLKSMIAGMDYFFKELIADGYTITEPLGFYTNNTKLYLNGKYSNITLGNYLAEKFGEDSGFNLSSFSNLRVSADGSMSVASISYKSGSYGYIYYADTGNIYQLNNSYFMTDAAYGGNPAITIILDEESLKIKQTYETDCKLIATIK